jgi:hypothetical protein
MIASKGINAFQASKLIGFSSTYLYFLLDPDKSIFQSGDVRVPTRASVAKIAGALGLDASPLLEAAGFLSPAQVEKRLLAAGRTYWLRGGTLSLTLTPELEAQLEAVALLQKRGRAERRPRAAQGPGGAASVEAGTGTEEGGVTGANTARGGAAEPGAAGGADAPD